MVAIDGSKFKAAASRDQVVTVKGLVEEQRRIDKSIDRYLERLEEADREEEAAPEFDKEQVNKADDAFRARGLCSSL